MRCTQRRWWGFLASQAMSSERVSFGVRPLARAILTGMSERVRRADKQSKQPGKYWSGAHTKRLMRDHPAFLL